jgi:hypothetical protein
MSSFHGVVFHEVETIVVAIAQQCRERFDRRRGPFARNAGRDFSKPGLTVRFAQTNAGSSTIL